jgi:glycerol-3-phosphate acyltransferase PlsY
VLFAGAWPLGLAAGVIWLAVATIFRMSSLAALSAAALTPVLAMIAGFQWSEVIFTVLLAALIFWRHSANIARIRDGTEPKIGADKAKAAVAVEAAPVAATPEPPAPADS